MIHEQQDRHRSAMGLRTKARRVLDQFDCVGDQEMRRELARQAFKLVQQAVELEPYQASMDGRSQRWHERLRLLS
jgi:hypothetical protein